MNKNLVPSMIAGLEAMKPSLKQGDKSYIDWIKKFKNLKVIYEDTIFFLFKFKNYGC
jgi:hypothetical protein